ncbi:ABC transporter substrate-binding protein [Streptomyces laculatispora]|uniref:ABC transporter substrate-binding protein n=1 Tax=Streptomyces laculatispora TaxID=887464 RepID=UPI001A94C787|nr:extracellular solute-binding protein [Streptomyces laculatispora]MBO0913333.1 extracellular solute-binding protein [Streptomyces laculatispora]
MNRWGTGAKTRAALSVCGALLLTACGSGSGGSGGDSDELLVWVDNTRTAAAKEYAKAHPDQRIRVVTIPPDAGYVPTKISLANRTKRGWPDVVFLANPSETATLAAEPFDYAAPLDAAVPKKTLDGFAPGALDTCTFDGKTYCLRNDIAPAILWYDSELMKKYGYQVPTTWEEYQKVGLKAAAQHPGTIVGSVAGKYGAGLYFGSSGCPTRDTLSLTKVRIDTGDDTCTRVADVLQPLTEKKAVTNVVPTEPAFAKLGADDKILMLPGPAWFGDFMFEPSFKVPEGRIAAARMPLWKGESKSAAGQVGGGAYVVSKHAGKRAKAATDLVTWLTTDVPLQAKQPTYPAFTAAATEWGKAKAKDTYYAANPVPVLTEAAANLRPGFGAVRYEAEWQSSFNDTLGAAAGDGKSLKDSLGSWQKRLEQAAKTSNYTVE